MSRVVSFSVQPRRTDQNKLVDWYKMHGVNPGPNFSTLCLEALKHYKETVLDAKTKVKVSS